MSSEALLRHPYLCAHAVGGRREVLAAGSGAALVAVEFPGQRIVHGLGSVAGQAQLSRELFGPGQRSLGAQGALWLTTGAAEAAGLLDDGGFVRAWSDWLWLGYRGPDPADPGRWKVAELDAVRDGSRIATCLREANPTASMAPEDADVRHWWGVADDDGRLLGVIAAAEHAPGQLLELHSLGTLPEARGSGVGGALFRAATSATLRINEQLGYRISHLGVYPDNADALSWYRRLGYGDELPRTSLVLA